MGLEKWTPLSREIHWFPNSKRSSNPAAWRLADSGVKEWVDLSRFHHHVLGLRAPLFFWPCLAAAMTCGGQLPNRNRHSLVYSVEFLSSCSLLSRIEADHLKFVCKHRLSSLKLWIKDAFELSVMAHYFHGFTLHLRRFLERCFRAEELMSAAVSSGPPAYILPFFFIKMWAFMCSTPVIVCLYVNRKLDFWGRPLDWLWHENFQIWTLHNTMGEGG